MKLTPEQQILCNLLKIALWPEQDKEALLTGFKQVNWDKVISFASIQGVLGISYDGFYDVVSRNYKCTENGKLECTENGNNGAQLFYFQKYVIFPHFD